MRVACAVLLLGSLLSAEDFVHLHRGGILRGAIEAETASEVVLDLGTGTISIPRSRIRLVERGATRRKPRRLVTQRDEWFLVFHRKALVGWRRVMHTVGPRREQVEERTTFFRPGGGDDVDVRRVEVADRDGKPREFLLMERYGTGVEIVSGQVVAGEVRLQVRRAGEFETRTLDLPEGWVLALPAWSRFLREARPGETRSIRALDPRRLATTRILLRRDEDAAAEAGPCRQLTRIGDFRRARALYRPGEGSIRVELNGSMLVARRTTRARVDLARRAHAAPRPLGIEQAKRYPFHERPENLTAYHPEAGIVLVAPDAGWVAHRRAAERGLVLSFEKVGLFASLEAFVHALPDGKSDVDACLAQALRRLRVTAQSVRLLGETRSRTVGGRAVRTRELSAVHRGERLHCLVAVVRSARRYAVLVGAAPERTWRWAKDGFGAIVSSVELPD